jgi:zinc D-Ala-D-Ala carboxypeptidase
VRLANPRVPSSFPASTLVRLASLTVPSSFAASTVVRVASLTVPSPTARPSSMTRFRVWRTLIQLSSVPCARAATDAAGDGVEFFVDSGCRSREYQNQLLREAVSEYASQEEAARWVATAETSAHVSGDAVDIGPVDATAWLSAHGAQYGLCRIYSNEPWHYELRPDAIDHGCPPTYADPTHDPRMQQ